MRTEKESGLSGERRGKGKAEAPDIISKGGKRLAGSKKCNCFGNGLKAPNGPENIAAALVAAGVEA